MHGHVLEPIYTSGILDIMIKDIKLIMNNSDLYVQHQSLFAVVPSDEAVNVQTS